MAFLLVAAVTAKKLQGECICAQHSLSSALPLARALPSPVLSDVKAAQVTDVTQFRTGLYAALTSA